VGAAGGIGQPLSLLLKTSPLVTQLNLFDLAPITPGVAADISHIDTRAQVRGFTGPDNLGAALKDCDLVIVPAGVPRKPGMTRDDLFNINAGIVAGIAKSAAQNCPNAALCIISNPVNSTVPIMAEVLKKEGVYNPKKLFGVTSLDICRANAFVAENQNFDVDETSVSVIGGHAGITIIPLLSQVPNAKFTQEDTEKLTNRIMFGGDEVVQAKAGGGSATLSMAYAGFQFAHRVLQALDGEEGIIENSYIDNDSMGPAFFSLPVELGRDGIKAVHPIGELSEYEQTLLAAAKPELDASIAKGVAFVAENYKS
jgi:malate dehydrogenase